MIKVQGKFGRPKIKDNDYKWAGCTIPKPRIEQLDSLARMTWKENKLDSKIRKQTQDYLS